jgi:hypothetical protein
MGVGDVLVGLCCHCVGGGRWALCSVVGLAWLLDGGTVGVAGLPSAASASRDYGPAVQVWATPLAPRREPLLKAPPRGVFGFAVPKADKRLYVFRLNFSPHLQGCCSCKCIKCLWRNALLVRSRDPGLGR